MTNQINDRGLEAACKAMVLKIAQDDDRPYPNETVAETWSDWLPTTQVAIQAYLPFHKPANQEDCRASFGKWAKSQTNYGAWPSQDRLLWSCWQAVYQSRAVVDDGYKAPYEEMVARRNELSTALGLAAEALTWYKDTFEQPSCFAIDLLKKDGGKTSASALSKIELIKQGNYHDIEEIINQPTKTTGDE